MFGCWICRLSGIDAGSMIWIVVLLRGRLAGVDGRMGVGGDAPALMGLQSMYGVFFVALDDDAAVDALVRFCPIRRSRSLSHSAFRKAPSIARDFPYSFARRSRCEMMFCMAERVCCTSSSGDAGRGGSGGARRSSGVHSEVSSGWTRGRKIGKS